MSDRKDVDLVADILDAARRAEDYVGGMTFEEFQRDTRTQDAVIRNLEIVGEAAKLVSGGFEGKHADVPRKQMAAMRDVVITTTSASTSTSSGRWRRRTCQRSLPASRRQVSRNATAFAGRMPSEGSRWSHCGTSAMVSRQPGEKTSKEVAR